MLNIYVHHILHFSIGFYKAIIKVPTSKVTETTAHLWMTLRASVFLAQETALQLMCVFELHLHLENPFLVQGQHLEG